MISRRRSRILAFQALYAWEANGQVLPPDLIRFPWYENASFQGKKGTEDEHVFARLMVLGTIETIKRIDDLIKKQTEHWDFNRINRVDLAILRMSVYALIQQRDIPVGITIDEAVSIAKEYSSSDSYRFINGVLDGIKNGLGG